MSEDQQVFHFPKTTGTHADVFGAVGLADLLTSISDAGPATVAETDSDFEVVLSRPIKQSELSHIPVAPGYPFLKTNEKTTVPPGAIDVVDYKAEKAKADRRRQLLASQKAGKAGAVDAELLDALQRDQPREDWRLLQVLNVLQGDDTSNGVHTVIVGRTSEQFGREVEAGIQSLVEGGHSGLSWKVSTVQLFVPTGAKGYSRLKPDGTDRNDKTKEQWADPFVEWLRYRGYFKIACPFFQGQKGEHIRLICPVPHDISLRSLEFVARELRKEGVYGGPPKMDSLAVLRLAELLIRHSEEYHEADVEALPGLSLLGKTPAQIVSGVFVTHYQSMGSAKAVSAMSTVALPGWFRVAGPETATLWIDILREHQAVVRGLRDDHSDEIGLLIQYRQFLEKRGDASVLQLVEFMERYGAFLLRAREQGRKVRAFRTDHFGRIVMETELSRILKDAGFQAVATAVRKATVSAQTQKAMGGRDYREIRYELLHDLRRKRSLPGSAPLLEAVSDFVSKYNFENARRREMQKPAARNVTTEEFASFVALVEEYGAPLVGALLGAYGSCREPRDEELAGTPEEPQLAEANPA